jgi:hypothetical protein
MSEQIETSSKKVRGMAKASLDLIGRMYSIIEAVQPITGRGVGYKLPYKKWNANEWIEDFLQASGSAGAEAPG